MEIYLQTERMILRQFERQDKEFIRDLDSDPEVMTFLSNGVPSDEDEVQRAIGVILDCKTKFNGELGFYIAINKETGAEMGWFHLRPLKAFPNDRTRLEIGYRLKREFWGLNFGTEGSKALVQHAFSLDSTKEIWAHAMSGNIASRRVMEKAGLKFHREEIYEPWPGDDKRCVWYLRCRLSSDVNS